MARKGTQHRGERLRGLERGIERTKASPWCQGVFSGSVSITSGVGDEGRFCAMSGPFREGLAVPFWSPWLEREAETLVPCRPCVRAKPEGGQERSLPPQDRAQLPAEGNKGEAWPRTLHGESPGSAHHLFPCTPAPLQTVGAVASVSSGVRLWKELV